MSLEAEGRVKKPYQPPKLSVYGDLTQMTKTNAHGSGSKDKANGNTKT
jgi:hypothetical protein